MVERELIRLWRPLTQAALLALAVSALAGCGGSDDAGAPGTSSGSASGGISADEAKSRDVFVNDFDAKLELRARPGGDAVYVLTNVGKREDRYVITVEPASAGSVEPAEASLAVGESAEVTVQIEGPGTIQVRSLGRGDEVAAEPFG
jgi:hypothetical protein